MISAALSANIRVRAVFRLIRSGLHLLWGSMTVATVFPFIGIGLQRKLKQRWSRQLADILGVKVVGDIDTLPAGLLVANHISFLDIFVINAVAPAAFVSKADVGGWPVIGWLCRHTETLFMERGSRVAAQKARHAIVTELRRGNRVAIFPEGTSTPGDRVLPFHGALFQSAVDAGQHVTPVALRYTDSAGRPDTRPAYAGETTLLECLWRIAQADQIQAHVHTLPSLCAVALHRHDLAARAHRAIEAHVNPSPQERPAADTAVEIPGDLRGERRSGSRPTDIRNPAPTASALS